MNGFVTVIEAARRLGVSDSRVRQLILEGTLPAQKIGNVVLLIPIVEISALKRQRRANAKKKAA